jgi:hypothetical protein
VEKDAARAPVIRVTAQGVIAQDAYRRRLGEVEKQWQERFGMPALCALAEALRPFTPERLFRGMKPYPEGWRANVREPEVLPYYPMVLHRGGYPDGS